MSSVAATEDRRTAICPACGYPSTDLCAACSQMAQAVRAYRGFQGSVAVVVQPNPVA